MKVDVPEGSKHHACIPRSLLGQFEDGLRAEDQVLCGDQMVRLDVDFLREGLGGDQ